MRCTILLSLLFLNVKGQFEGLETLQEVLDLSVSKYKIVGVAASGFTGYSGTVLSAQSGTRKFGDETPIEFSDQWVMGSNTKSMVSTVAARVVELGFINWTTTTKDIFHDAGLFEVNEGYWESSLELFLSHGSGAPGLLPVQADFPFMTDEVFNKTSWEPDYDNRAERIYVASTLLKEKPYQPLYTYEYSIGGFTVAGCMLEVATGKTFEQLCKELLFEPLQMDGCGFGPTTTDSSLPPLAPWGHLSDPFGYLNLPILPGLTSNIGSALVPDGGIKCNLDSWQNYLVAHMTKDATFLPAEQWEHIHTPIVGGFYGFGWFVYNDPTAGTVLTHGGTDGHNFANCMVIPRFQVGANFGYNNGMGGIQGIASDRLFEWILAHMAGEKNWDLINSVGEALEIPKTVMH